MPGVWVHTPCNRLTQLHSFQAEKVSFLKGIKLFEFLPRLLSSSGDQLIVLQTICTDQLSSHCRAQILCRSTPLTLIELSVDFLVGQRLGDDLAHGGAHVAQTVQEAEELLRLLHRQRDRPCRLRHVCNSQPQTVTRRAGGIFSARGWARAVNEHVCVKRFSLRDPFVSNIFWHMTSTRRMSPPRSLRLLTSSVVVSKMLHQPEHEPRHHEVSDGEQILGNRQTLLLSLRPMTRAKSEKPDVQRCRVGKVTLVSRTSTDWAYENVQFSARETAHPIAFITDVFPQSHAPPA